MLMSKKQCQAKNKRGVPCNASASETGFCFTHDVSKGKERAIARRNGGLQRITPHVADVEKVPKQIRSIEAVLCVLDYALEETFALSNGVQRGRLLVSISHCYIEALKTGELEARLEAIEQALKIRKDQQQRLRRAV